MKGKIINTSGFTLVELMITLLISGIIVAAIYSAYTAQQRTYLAQEQVAEMQQNIRAGLGMLTRDIRLAGYDPSGSGSFGFVDHTPPPPLDFPLFSNGSTQTEEVFTSSARIAFTADLDDDGAIDRAAEDINSDTNKDMTEMEQIAYRLNGTDLERYSTITGFIEWQDIANNIEAVEFNYTFDNNNPLPTPNVTLANLGNIRSVQVTILARASQSDRKFTNTMTYTTASGATWGPYNDNFRRRLLITTVNCRNMGL